MYVTFTHRLESAKVSMGCPANFSMLYLQSKNNSINDAGLMLMLSLMNEGMPISEMCELSRLYCFSFLKPELISSLYGEKCDGMGARQEESKEGCQYF